ncbi:MAG TPA: NAD(P)H-dependent oxidoreductase [Amycolatopsis sp.]|jgi:NAD(P)H-dependent FMN reductase
MTRIAVITGSTRPRRRATMVAEWVVEVAARHVPADAATFELVDIADFALPMLDEEVPAAIGSYANEHTRQWAETIAGFDGFVFVTPEYNHSMTAALKNAIDFLFAEWGDKAAGFVSYGLHGGVRAVEHLRVTLAEVKIADVRTTVALSLFTDFQLTDMTQPGVFAPGDHQEPTLTRMLDEVVAWSRALAPLRVPQESGEVPA